MLSYRPMIRTWIKERTRLLPSQSHRPTSRFFFELWLKVEKEKTQHITQMYTTMLIKLNAANDTLLRSCSSNFLQRLVKRNTVTVIEFDCALNIC